jgi:hypothetical protein
MIVYKTAMKKVLFKLALSLKTYMLIVFMLLSGYSIYSQTNSSTCDCARSQYTQTTKADTLYHLSNGKSIALCGYFESKSKKTEFSEFTLTVCGQNKIIDFWGAAYTCRIQVKNDTLLVHVLKDLLYGMNIKFQPTIWTTEKIYFSGQKVVRKLALNRQIQKYNQAEISTVLKAFETTKPGFDDDKLTLANELFIASISGNIKAREYFLEFKTKFGILDGVYQEEYEDLTQMLKFWDRKE